MSCSRAPSAVSHGTALREARECTVVSTSLPASARRVTANADSESRISPTSTTSRSCLASAGVAAGKSMPSRGLISVRTTPSTSYSTGSSIVATETSSLRSAVSIA